MEAAVISYDSHEIFRGNVEECVHNNVPGYGGRPTTGLNTICSLAGRGKASEGVKARSFDPIRSERVTDSNCFLQVSK